MAPGKRISYRMIVEITIEDIEDSDEDVEEHASPATNSEVHAPNSWDILTELPLPAASSLPSLLLANVETPEHDCFAEFVGWFPPAEPSAQFSAHTRAQTASF